MFEEVGAVRAEAAQFEGETKQEELHALECHGIHGGAPGHLAREGPGSQECGEGGALPRDDAAKVPGDPPVVPGALQTGAAHGPAPYP